MRLICIETSNFRSVERWFCSFHPRINHISCPDKLRSVAVGVSGFFGGLPHGGPARPMSLSRERDRVSVWVSGYVGTRSISWEMEKRGWVKRKNLNETVRQVLEAEDRVMPVVALYVEDAPKGGMAKHNTAEMYVYGHSLQVLKARLKHWRYARLECRHLKKEDPRHIEKFLDFISKAYLGRPWLVTSEDLETFFVGADPLKLGECHRFDVVVDLAYKAVMADILSAHRLNDVQGVVVIDREWGYQETLMLADAFPDIQFFFKKELDTTSSIS